jgi:hypothetical protein
MKDEKFEFVVNVMGNGAETVKGSLDNPGSCIPGQPLSLAEDHDFGYKDQVVVNTDHSDQDVADVFKIGHVQRGSQEIFVKQCLNNNAWQVTAVCVTASARDYRSSKIYGFKMQIIVECYSAIDVDLFRASYQLFVDANQAELAEKEKESKMKKDPWK